MSNDSESNKHDTGLLQLANLQTSLDVTRTRNRLAQRKHRQRMRGSADFGHHSGFAERQHVAGNTAAPSFTERQKPGEQCNGQINTDGEVSQRTAEPSLKASHHAALTLSQTDSVTANLTSSLPESGNWASSASHPVSPQGGPSFNVFDHSSEFRSGDPYIEDYGSEWPRHPPSYLDHANHPVDTALTPGELPPFAPAAGTLLSQTQRHQRHSNAQQAKSMNINHESPDTEYFHSAFGFASSATQYGQAPGSLNSMEMEFSSTEVDVETTQAVEVLPPPDGKECSPDAHSPSASMDLESRFERILDSIEEAGFDSIESMAAEYYAATFKGDTTPHWAQSLSKTRNLQRFLAALHTSTKDWSSEEARGYHEQIFRSAENIYVEELQRLKQSIMRDRINQMQPASSECIWRARIGEQFKQLFQDAESSRLFKQDKKLLQQQIPEIWSLLTQLARNAELSHAQGTQAVCGFLYMLKALK